MSRRNNPEKLDAMREKDKLRKRLFRENNPEKIKSSRTKFLAKNPSYFAKKMSEYRKKYPERYKQQQKEYYRMHRKELRQNLLKRWTENPELKKQAMLSLTRTVAKNRVKYNQRKMQKYHENKSQILEERKVRRFLQKLEVMSHYSKGTPKCVLCGENMIDFLNIDHVRPRKEHGHGRTFGSDRLRSWLIKHSFPSGFQILCYNCNMIKESELRENRLSKKPDNVKEREWKRRFKHEVLSHYAKGKPKCNCCGFSNLYGLSIDHIQGRKSVGHDKSLRSHRLLQWLKRKNYPTGYQVLCINCNSAKSDSALCPHQAYN